MNNNSESSEFNLQICQQPTFASLGKTVCAELTPVGRGAIAVVGLLGPNAESALDRAFLPANGRTFSKCLSRSIVYGNWGSTGEDLVVSRRGDEHFEVHCHGGSTVAGAIIQSLEANGISPIGAEEFSLSYESDWAQSVQDELSHATTQRTARILVRQLELLPRAISELEELIRIGSRSDAIAKIASMLQWADFGTQLTRLRSIVLCGQPNVGKSSLVNAIVGFERAIVHDLPGTTRDVVSQTTAIDGWAVELKDTAGLRESTNPIESQGIEKAKFQIESADLRICVFDGSVEWSLQDQKLVDSIRPDAIIHNKLDLVGSDSMGNGSSIRPQGFETSTVTGNGIETMIQAVGSLLVPSTPGNDAVFPVNEIQRDKLVQVLANLKSN